MGTCNWIKKLIVRLPIFLTRAYLQSLNIHSQQYVRRGPNKINTYQLKIPTKQLKANSEITSYTKQNMFYLIHVTRQ